MNFDKTSLTSYITQEMPSENENDALILEKLEKIVQTIHRAHVIQKQEMHKQLLCESLLNQKQKEEEAELQYQATFLPSIPLNMTEEMRGVCVKEAASHRKRMKSIAEIDWFFEEIKNRTNKSEDIQSLLSDAKRYFQTHNLRAFEKKLHTENHALDELHQTFSQQRIIEIWLASEQIKPIVKSRLSLLLKESLHAQIALTQSQIAQYQKTLMLVQQKNQDAKNEWFEMMQNRNLLTDKQRMTTMICEYEKRVNWLWWVALGATVLFGVLLAATFSIPLAGVAGVAITTLALTSCLSPLIKKTRIRREAEETMPLIRAETRIIQLQYIQNQATRAIERVNKEISQLQSKEVALIQVLGDVQSKYDDKSRYSSAIIEGSEASFNNLLFFSCDDRDIHSGDRNLPTPIGLRG